MHPLRRLSRGCPRAPRREAAALPRRARRTVVSDGPRRRYPLEPQQPRQPQAQSGHVGDQHQGDQAHGQERPRLAAGAPAGRSRRSAPPRTGTRPAAESAGRCSGSGWRWRRSGPGPPPPRRPRCRGSEMNRMMAATGSMNMPSTSMIRFRVSSSATGGTASRSTALSTRNGTFSIPITQVKIAPHPTMIRSCGREHRGPIEHRQELRHAERAIQERRDQQGVEGRQTARLGRGHDAAEDAGQDDRGDHQRRERAPRRARHRRQRAIHCPRPCAPSFAPGTRPASSGRARSAAPGRRRRRRGPRWRRPSSSP